MRSGRGLRDEFRVFYARAYPELVAQVLAITGDAHIATAAAESTLATTWRVWPSMRQSADPLVRARWTAVTDAARHQAAGGGPARDIRGITGEAGENAVVVTALQLLPPVQRRALVLHYMGGLTVNDMAALSGSSAEHIEMLLEEGFTALAETLDWVDDHSQTASDQADPPDELDRRFDWTASALADTAARLPDEITAPSPSRMLRRAALVRWSTRAAPVAAGAACVAVAVIISAQPGTSSDLGRPTIYAQNDNPVGAPVRPSLPGLVPPAGVAAALQRTAPVVGLHSVALTSLLDPSAVLGAAVGHSGDVRSSRETPRLVSVSSASGSLPSVTSPGSSISLATGGTTATGAGGTGTTTSGATPPSPPSPPSPPITTTTVPVPVPTPPVDTITTPPVPTTDPVETTTPPVPTTDLVTTDPVTTEPTTTEPTTTEPTTTTVDTTSPEHTSTDDTPTSDKGESADNGA